MKLGFIGAGKVGTSLGAWFMHNGITVSGWYSHSEASAKQAAEHTQTTCFSSLADICKSCDTLFVTTPDGVISSVWDELKTLPIEGKRICHCSGALPSAVFSGAAECGAFVCSVHPLLAVSERFLPCDRMASAFFTLEGSGASEMRQLLEQCGAQTAVIAAEDKARYHLAACVVSNLAVGLSDWGMQLLEQCGFTAQQAQTALTPLILGNAQTVCAAGTTAALTGPAERGDTETIRRHMDCLTPEEQKLYAMLTLRLCSIAHRKHPNRTDTALTDYLEGLL